MTTQCFRSGIISIGMYPFQICSALDICTFNTAKHLLILTLGMWTVNDSGIYQTYLYEVAKDELCLKQDKMIATWAIYGVGFNLPV